MPKIIVGGGTGQAVLNVPWVPEVGETITVQPWQVVAAASRLGNLLPGSAIRLTSKTTKELGGGESVPWFGFESTKP